MGRNTSVVSLAAEATCTVSHPLERRLAAFPSCADQLVQSAAAVLRDHFAVYGATQVERDGGVVNVVRSDLHVQLSVALVDGAEKRRDGVDDSRVASRRIQQGYNLLTLVVALHDGSR